MKRFTHTVAKIKNSSGEYEPIPALRGMSSYETAVEAGYTGSQEEWLALTIRALDDGWVTKYEELEANKANKSDVYTKTDIDEQMARINADNIPLPNKTAVICDIADATVDDALNCSLPIASYLALAGNVNEDLTNAALGKNNEDNVVGVGRALAMYAKFNDPTLTLQSSFPNLILSGKLSKIGKSAVKELNKSECLRTLFSSNDYAFENAILPNVYGLIATKDYHPDIEFTNDSSASYTGKWLTGTGFGFVYNGTITGGSATTYDTVTSTSSFDTNGAKYLVFQSIDVASLSQSPIIGVLGDTLEYRWVTITDPSSEKLWYAIEVSDFTSIQFTININRNKNGTSVILDNVIFTDFLPICQDMITA